MYRRFQLFFSLFLILFPVSETFAADITWKIYLKQYQNELLTKDTREGEEFSIPVVFLPAYASTAQRLFDALERTRFFIQQTPGSRPLEIRIILNIQGDSFENARPDVPVFISFTLETWVDFRKDTSLRFLSNSPLVMTIPASGVDALLRLSHGDLKRGEDLLMAFDLGTRFSNEGITTSNTTSGITAGISHPSVIVGSRYDLLKLQQPVKINTWGKIKLLFQ
jgi:hypothetical protein